MSSSSSTAPPPATAADRPPADDGFKLLRHMARKGEVELKKAQESTLIVLGDRLVAAKRPQLNRHFHNAFPPLSPPFFNPRHSPRAAGKTSLISAFLDLDSPVPAKPTLGIE